MESQLCMAFASYCNEEFKPNDDENEHYIDRVMVEGANGDDEEDRDDEDVELVKLVNQYMAPHTPKFKVVWMINMDAVIKLIVVGI